MDRGQWLRCPRDIAPFNGVILFLFLWHSGTAKVKEPHVKQASTISLDSIVPSLPSSPPPPSPPLLSGSQDKLFLQWFLEYLTRYLTFPSTKKNVATRVISHGIPLESIAWLVYILASTLKIVVLFYYYFFFYMCILCFQSRGQHLCKFIGTKESVYIRKEFNSRRTGLGHNHGRRFIVLGHKYGRHDVMRKHNITRFVINGFLL